MRTIARTALAGILFALGAVGMLLWALRPSREASVPAATGPPDGRALYATHCAACHGAGGKGDGPGAAVVRTPMPDFTTQAAMKRVEDTFLAAIIKKGGSQFGRSNAMPAWGMKLSDAEIRALVHYIRSLAGPGSSTSSVGR